ncbi:MAG: transketolase, partial [Planctomycetes bacterium]|nr:transketolase [Planctomycetota bacterium]
HGKALSAEQTAAAVEELKLPPRPAELADLVPPAPRGRKIKPTPELVPLDPPDFSAVAKGGKLATRKAYGIGLRELGRKNPHVVALDADVQGSTFSIYFHKEFPDRFVECKIAEQNMVSAAGGFAAGGMLPFANTFGKFFARAYDQIEMAAIGGLNLKLAGSHSGVTLAADGPSQMALTDVPLIRSLGHVRLTDGRPMLQMLMPSDAVCAYRCVELAARHNGMVYIRTLRPDMPILYDASETFKMGGAKVLRDGRDVTLVGSGYMVHTALSAAERLATEGVGCRVVDCYGLPVADEALLAMARDPNEKMLVLDDSYIGSVGSELAEVAAAWRGAQVVTMSVAETPKSAREPHEVLEQVGLGEEAIVARARDLARDED